MENGRFDRLQRLVGQVGFEQLQKSSVAVFGVGGVGGYAVEALVRSGVGKLVLIDFDTVAVSNINRQIQALDATVGRVKVDVLAERCLAINPAIKVVAENVAYQAEKFENTVLELQSEKGHMRHIKR